MKTKFFLTVFALLLGAIAFVPRESVDAARALIQFERSGVTLNGLEWILPNSETVVGGMTVYKEASNMPNRLWIYSNYEHGKNNSAIEAAGEIVLATRDGANNVLLLRVLASPDERAVIVRGGDLVVTNGILRLGETRLRVNPKTGDLEIELENGARKVIRARE